jgi:hypothetical protein
MGIEFTIPAFLNVAIGQLLAEFPAETLREKLALVDLTPDDRLLVRRVVDNAKAYMQSRTDRNSFAPGRALSSADSRRAPDEKSLKECSSVFRVFRRFVNR